MEYRFSDVNSQSSYVPGLTGREEGMLRERAYYLGLPNHLASGKEKSLN